MGNCCVVSLFDTHRLNGTSRDSNQRLSKGFPAPSRITLLFYSFQNHHPASETLIKDPLPSNVKLQTRLSLPLQTSKIRCKKLQTCKTRPYMTSLIYILIAELCAPGYRKILRAGTTTGIEIVGGEFGNWESGSLRNILKIESSETQFRT